jgi:hypothetical protein
MRRMFVSTATLLGLLFLGFAMLVLAMRSHRRHSPPAPPHFDFSIDELHRLHQAGQLSAEEYARAKAIVLERRARADLTTAGIPSSGRGFEVMPQKSRGPDS